MDVTAWKNKEAGIVTSCISFIPFATLSELVQELELALCELSEQPGNLCDQIFVQESIWVIWVYGAAVSLRERMLLGPGSVL